MSKQNELDRAAGAELRALREKARRSQEDLSMEIDLDQSTLSKVERLGPSAVGWPRFCRIAETLGYQVEITFRSAPEEKATSVADPGAGRRR